MFQHISCLSAFLLLATACQGQDLWCINCREHFDVNGDWIGTGRLDDCPCCRAQDCADAAAKAERLRSTYGPLRARYDSLRREIAALKSAGKDVPRAMSNEEAQLNFDLGQLELQYAILKEECPAQVMGNLWDGAGGPVEDSPAAGDAASRSARAATKAAKNYQRLTREEAHQLDVILNFLGTAADGYAPPASGFNGERAQAAKQYSELAASFESAAEELAKPVRAAAEPGAVLEPKKPTLAKLKVPARASPELKQQANALQARLNANTYVRAYLDAREGQRAAQRAGDAEAAKSFGRDAVKYIWIARQVAQIAAKLQKQADASHQKALDASLSDAAKRGVGLDELLKRFQSQVKAKGVPSEIREAMTTAGASAEEVEAAGKRLLELTTKDVERVLKTRRGQVQDAESTAEARDAFVIEAQYMAARADLHRPREKKEAEQKKSENKASN